MRHVKFRPGQDQSLPGTLTNDGISNYLQNSIIDHVSVSWADDEGLSSTDRVENTTVQYSLIGEGLNYNDHSYGSLISSENDDAEIGYHHNLYLHNRSRNPRLGSEAGKGAITSFTNNVVYNWFGRAGYSIDNKPSRTNYLSNYYIAGSNTGSGDDVFYSPDVSTIIYHDDTNRVDMNKNGAVDGVVFGFSGPQFSGTYQEALTPYNVPSGHVQSASDAVDQVLDYVGAKWWDRDPIDARLTDDVRNGTGSTIDNITDAPQDPNYTYDAEGYPIYGVSERPANFDVDGDGMPGAWEVMHGLDPNLPDNNGDFDNDSYTNLEEYINELAAFPAPTSIQWFGGDGRFAQIQNWGISQTIPENTFTNWQPSRFDVAVIENATVEVDAVGQHAGSLYLENDTTLNITAGWLKVEDETVGPGNGELVIGVSVGDSAALNITGGRLITKTLSKGAAGTFSFTGGVLSAEEVNFDLVNNGGTIAPGNSPGNTHVVGDLTINSGAVEIEIASTGSFDLVEVDGTATLAGDLDVLELDYFTPAPTDQFVILTAGTLMGTFANAATTVNSLLGTYDVTYDYSANTVKLSNFEQTVLPGDYNDDGEVSAADYTVWQDNLGSTAGLPNETETLGVVDEADYELWKLFFGATLGGGSGSGLALVAVPEPATLMLSVLGGLALLAWRPTLRRTPT